MIIAWTPLGISMYQLAKSPNSFGIQTANERVTVTPHGRDNKKWIVLFLVKSEMIRCETVAQIVVRTDPRVVQQFILKHLFTPLFLVSFNWNQLNGIGSEQCGYFKWPMNNTTKKTLSSNMTCESLLTFNLAGAFVWHLIGFSTQRRYTIAIR